MHAEVRVDDAVVMIADKPNGRQPEVASLHVYVKDVDESFRRAIEAGGEPVQEPMHKDHDPDRRGGVKGPGGNTWWISTQVE